MTEHTPYHVPRWLKLFVWTAPFVMLAGFGTIIAYSIFQGSSEIAEISASKKAETAPVSATTDCPPTKLPYRYSQLSGSPNYSNGRWGIKLAAPDGGVRLLTIDVCTGELESELILKP